MAGTNYSGNGAKPTLPIVLINDGEDFTFETFMVGVMEKVIDWLSALDAGKEQVAAYAGDAYTIAAGPLKDFLHLLADKTARQDQTNTFLGNNDHQGTETFEKAVYIAAGGYIARPAVSVSVSATTLAMDVTAHSEYVAEAWAGAGGNLAVSFSAFGGAGNPEMSLTFHPADLSAVATTGGAFFGYGLVTWRWNGSAWMLR